MYEAKFIEEDIVLKEREYIRLFVDYDSGHYKGRFYIDILKKEGLVGYLDEINKEIAIFDKQRKEAGEKYESDLFSAVKQKYREISGVAVR